MTGADRPGSRPAAAEGIYEFSITGTVGPLTRAALSDFDAVVIPRFTVLTGTCDGPDDLQPLLTALDTHGTPATKVRAAVTTGPAPIDEHQTAHQPPKGAVPT